MEMQATHTLVRIHRRDASRRGGVIRGHRGALDLSGDLRAVARSQRRNGS